MWATSCSRAVVGCGYHGSVCLWLCPPDLKRPLTCFLDLRIVGCWPICGPGHTDRSHPSVPKALCSDSQVQLCHSSTEGLRGQGSRPRPHDTPKSPSVKACCPTEHAAISEITASHSQPAPLSCGVCFRRRLKPLFWCQLHHVFKSGH